MNDDRRKWLMLSGAATAGLFAAAAGSKKGEAQPAGGGLATAIASGTNLTVGNVTDGNNSATQSLGVWMSYLTGATNPYSQLTKSMTAGIGGTPIGTPGAIISLAPNTYGTQWTGVSGAFMANQPGTAPGVGPTTNPPSGVATYFSRDSVALYSSNKDRAPVLTLNSPTYDTTHIFPATPLNPTQVASINIGAFIDTNEGVSPKFTGTITAVDPAGASITVGGGWFQMGNTASGQIPSGTTAYVDVVSSVFGRNTVVLYQGTYPLGNFAAGYGGCAGDEIDIQQNAPITIGNLWDTNTDNPSCNGIVIVSSGSQQCGAGIVVGGPGTTPFARGLLIKKATVGYIYGPASGTALSSYQTSGNIVEGRTTGGLPTIALTATGNIQLYTPASGRSTSDALISVDSGSSTANAGHLKITTGETRFFDPTGSGDAIDIIGQASGSGGIIQITSPSGTNCPINIKTKGTGGLTLLGNSSGFDAPIARFIPQSVSGGNQVNFFTFTASLTGGTPTIGITGVDANASIAMSGLGTGATVLGSATSDTITGKGSAGTTTETTGFMMIPFVAGAPTGVPTNAAKGIALVYDTTNHKLWAYDNGTSSWKGSVFS